MPYLFHPLEPRKGRGSLVPRLFEAIRQSSSCVAANGIKQLIHVEARVFSVHSGNRLSNQWRSQNRVVARAQVGQHIRCCAMCGKLACEARSFRGVRGHAPPPRKIFEFRTSEIVSAGFSGQVSVANISSVQEALSLLFSLFLLSIACWLFRARR